MHQGVWLHQRGQLAQARSLYEKVLQASPRHFDALHLLGVIAAQTGNPRLALKLLDQAVASKPEVAAAHCHRGNALKDLQRLDEALASYDQAIALDPGHADAHFNRGNVLQDLGRPQEALESHDRAIAIRPGHAETHFARGNALKDLGLLDQALAGFERAVALGPELAQAHSNRGLALQMLKRPVEALASFDRALAIQPGCAPSHSNRGLALQDLRRTAEALASFDRAIALRPDWPDAHSHRGNALQESGRLEEALASYDKAIAIQSDHAEAHWNKALALLSAGRFEQGWELFEWRWRNGNFAAYWRGFEQPLWLGDSDIRGKTVLLHAEQGLGDALQFCRYAAMVSQLGATVLLEVRKPLVGLMHTLAGVDRVLEQGQPLPPFDLHCPLMSLPLAFKTTPLSVPGAGGYLRSDPERRRLWSERLGAKSRLRVGLVWSGNPSYRGDAWRSLSLQEVLDHLPDGCEYISLQKDVRPQDRAALDSSRIRHFEAEHQDFSDSAAICDLVDVVLCSDTSGAHLAGALGRPAWLMLQHVPDWRWMLEGDRSPWYDSLRLCRQGPDRQWGPVLSQVAADLSSMAR